jgi:hypothetical protein
MRGSGGRLPIPQLIDANRFGNVVKLKAAPDTRGTAKRPTSCDFVPWRFSDADRRSAWIASSCRHSETCT